MVFLDFYDMQTNENHLYHAPQLEVLEIVVEQCFAASVEDPTEAPEIDW